jgi:hypothetical protein
LVLTSDECAKEGNSLVARNSMKAQRSTERANVLSLGIANITSRVRNENLVEERPAEVLTLHEEGYNCALKIFLIVLRRLHVNEIGFLWNFRAMVDMAPTRKWVSSFMGFGNGAEGHLFLTVSSKLQSDSFTLPMGKGSGFSVLRSCDGSHSP